MKRTLPSAAIALSLACGFALPNATRAEGQPNGAAPKQEPAEPEKAEKS